MDEEEGDAAIGILTDRESAAPMPTGGRLPKAKPGAGAGVRAVFVATCAPDGSADVGLTGRDGRRVSPAASACIWYSSSNPCETRWVAA